MEIKNVVVIGGGVLGSQIAYQAAYCGMRKNSLRSPRNHCQDQGGHQAPEGSEDWHHLKIKSHN